MNRHPANENLPDAGDQIGQLLRLAGPREAIPAAREERVRGAIHGVWREEARKRSRRRTATWAAGTLALAAALLLTVGLRFWPPGETAPPPEDVLVATVEATSGLPAFPAGLELPSGSAIDTGPAGRMALRLESGPALRLDAGTRLTLRSASSLTLDAGTVYVDSGPEASGAAVEVRTPYGVARDVGTQFEVRVGEGSLRLRVRDGEVLLAVDGSTHPAAAGIELEVDAGGRLTRRPVPPYGASWDWVLETAPSFDPAGRTLEEILDWIARETGWEIDLYDEEAVREKLGSEFQGSMPNLRAEEAADSVLLTFGLRSELEDGTLRILPY